MPDILTFTCSICGEPSQSICVYCTKDTCPNHLCERCLRCSDCCECNQRRQEPGEGDHTAHDSALNNGTAPAVHEPVSNSPPEAEQADSGPREETTPDSGQGRPE